jgi:RNA polymerase sigma factor (sigma-70 family)
MKDTTNRRARTGRSIPNSSSRSSQEQPAGKRPERIADLLAQFVPDLDRNAAEAYIQDRIAFRVDRLVAKFGLPDCERDDLSQDLLMALVQAFKRYDPAQAHWKTFLCRVLDRRYQHLLRKLMAPENKGAPTVSGLEDIGNGYADSIVDPSTQGEPFVGDNLHMDVEAAISTLPKRLQIIGCLLMVHSPSAVARLVGTSPAAITRAIKWIRTHFQEAGLSPF